MCVFATPPDNNEPIDTRQRRCTVRRKEGEGSNLKSFTNNTRPDDRALHRPQTEKKTTERSQPATDDADREGAEQHRHREKYQATTRAS